MKTTVAKAIALGGALALVGGWLLFVAVHDEPPVASPEIDAAEQRVSVGPDDPRRLPAHPNENRFPPPTPVTDFTKARHAAGQFAADGKHGQAQSAILHAVALNGGDPQPMRSFIQNWYMEKGRESIGLPLLIFAQRRGAKWAEQLIPVTSRPFDTKEERVMIAAKVEELERVYAQYAAGDQP